MKINPIIALFQAKAELLDVTNSTEGLDDATALLAGWIGKVSMKLSQDDMTILSDVGAVLYREGLRKKLQEN
jgi:hypothetical protein